MSLLATISVRLSAGTYTTSAWLGKTASSTQSAEVAAQKLMDKIDGLKHKSLINKGSTTNANGHPIALFEIWGKLPKAVRQ